MLFLIAMKYWKMRLMTKREAKELFLGVSIVLLSSCCISGVGAVVKTYILEEKYSSLKELIIEMRHDIKYIRERLESR